MAFRAGEMGRRRNGQGAHCLMFTSLSSRSLAQKTHLLCVKVNHHSYTLTLLPSTRLRKKGENVLFGWFNLFIKGVKTLFIQYLPSALRNYGSKKIS